MCGHDVIVTTLHFNKHAHDLCIAIRKPAFTFRGFDLLLKHGASPLLVLKSHKNKFDKTQLMMK